MTLTIPRVALVATLSVAAVTLAGCGEKKQAPPPQGPVSVGVVTVAPQPVTLSTELTGRTSAFRVAEVRPQVSGVILKRLFTEGGDVKAGQQLYQIDPAPYEATLASAKASLAQAEATVKSVKAKAERYADLVTVNAVSKQDYDDITASLATDLAAVDAARAQVKTAQINLDYTRVYSPISGRVGRSSVTEGALVTADQTTALATVQQLDPLYVDVTQSSVDLMRLRREIAAGHVKGATAGDAPISLLIDGLGDQPYGEPGRLQFADVTVDQTTGMVTLRATVPNPKAELLPGLFVRARVEEGVRDQAMLVPQQAVVRGADGGTTVWVVGQDNKATVRPVTTTQAQGDKWVVTGGLNAGDRVVVEGVQRLRPGADVKADEVKPQAAAPATPQPL
ncbi:efflux RND transporter periplasmic adaptor subunit [Nitrospirillum sp. BR 11163]|uniref:efflux RND transporter periplasmic adaptor subunit n=1 Tax=Nitrospirillum sp. BR 11163 TaxID=3104323 RepID=UPI002B0007FE|nr:efflux RND transporter periplasmic adaptor subunit [Nitrospirillum sp. BR 11163]MEA1672511.1 efflux RND transporter periplasmic adaptor subunit [Nitrospirillum sp. BR 11163]